MPESTTPGYSEYYRAVQQAEDDVADALSHIRAREDNHEIRPAEAATERVLLLDNHLERLHQLRVQYFGDDTP